MKTVRPITGNCFSPRTSEPQKDIDRTALHIGIIHLHSYQYIYMRPRLRTPPLPAIIISTLISYLLVVFIDSYIGLSNKTEIKTKPTQDKDSQFASYRRITDPNELSPPTPSCRSSQLNTYCLCKVQSLINSSIISLFNIIFINASKLGGTDRELYNLDCQQPIVRTSWVRASLNYINLYWFTELETRCTLNILCDKKVYLSELPSPRAQTATHQTDALSQTPTPCSRGPAV